IQAFDKIGFFQVIEAPYNTALQTDRAPPGGRTPEPLCVRLAVNRVCTAPSAFITASPIKKL
ncbi:hypothetical protein MJD09_26560, partial [bacterium]|nr:hypothetical protein [bacterium]